VAGTAGPITIIKIIARSMHRRHYTVMDYEPNCTITVLHTTNNLTEA